MTRRKRSTPKQKIDWLSKQPQLFSNFRVDRKVIPLVFERMKGEGLIAPSTTILDTDVLGYCVMAEKKFNCDILGHGEQNNFLAPYR